MVDVSAIKFVERLSEVKSLEDFRTQFADYLTNFGIEYYVISGIPGPYDDLDEFIVVHNLPSAWVTKYDHNNYVEHDPVARYCLETREPFSWSTATAKYSNDPMALRVMTEAREHGLRDGVCVPVHGINGYEAGVSLSGRSVEVTNELMRTMHMVSLYAFNYVKLLKRDSIIRLEPLTEREREILRWSSLGLTAGEIARTLNISETTVTSHIHNAMRKMSVKNKAEAIATSLRAGFISS